VSIGPRGFSTGVGHPNREQSATIPSIACPMTARTSDRWPCQVALPFYTRNVAEQQLPTLAGRDSTSHGERCRRRLCVPRLAKGP
jgi:hypothetical protein